MVIGFWYTGVPNFVYLSWYWRCKEHQCPLSPNLELWRMLDVPDWGIASWSWFGWVKEPCLDLTLSFHFTQIGRSWDFNFLCLCLCMCMCLCLCPTVILLSQAQMGFGFELWQFFYSHWYLIHMCSTFWLYIDFDGAKNIHVLYVPIWDFGGRWSLDVPDCSLVSLSWFVYGHWSLIHPGPKFWSPLLILKFAKNIHVLEEAGGSWLEFDILILIWI